MILITIINNNIMNRMQNIIKMNKLNINIDIDINIKNIN